jgi:hypothetical protein
VTVADPPEGARVPKLTGKFGPGTAPNVAVASVTLVAEAVPEFVTVMLAW